MVDPIDTDAIRSMIGDRSDNLYDAEIQRSALCDEVDRLRAENATLRDLLAKALPWIGPNESHDAFLLTVAIREALGEGS